MMLRALVFASFTLASTLPSYGRCMCACIAQPEGVRAEPVCDSPEDVSTKLAAITCPETKYCPLPSSAATGPPKDPQPPGCTQMRELGPDGVYHWERVCR